MSYYILQIIMDFDDAWYDVESPALYTFQKDLMKAGFKMKPSTDSIDLLDSNEEDITYLNFTKKKKTK